MTHPLDNEEVDHLKQLFQIFADKESAHITPQSFKALLASLDVNISKARASQLLQNWSDDPTSGISFPNFLLFYASNFKDINIHEEVKETFRLLKEDEGFVPVARLLKSFMGVTGMSARKARKVLKRSCPENEQANEWLEHGKMSLNEFVQFMLS